MQQLPLNQHGGRFAGERAVAEDHDDQVKKVFRQWHLRIRCDRSDEGRPSITALESYSHLRSPHSFSTSLLFVFPRSLVPSLPPYSPPHPSSTTHPVTNAETSLLNIPGLVVREAQLVPESGQAEDGCDPSDEAVHPQPQQPKLHQQQVRQDEYFGEGRGAVQRGWLEYSKPVAYLPTVRSINGKRVGWVGGGRRTREYVQRMMLKRILLRRADAEKSCMRSDVCGVRAC